VALVFLAAWAPGTALAQPPPGKPYDKERARALYDEGLRHYNVAEYDQAIDAFKSSYLVSGDARLLFNVAQAYRLKGDCEQALRFYKNFLRENTDSDKAIEVQAAIRKCETAPVEAATRPTEPPPAAGGRPAEPAAPTSPAPSQTVTAPAGSAPPAPPGSPAATTGQPARALGQPSLPAMARPTPTQAAPVEIAPAHLGARRPAPRSLAVSRSEERRDPGAIKRVTGGVLAGVGMALVGGGLYFGIKASNQASTTASYTGEWGPSEQSAEEQAQRDGRVGLLLTGLGITGVLTGGTLYWLGVTERDQGASLSLVPTSGGAAVVWRGKL
jgi:hypothetical protein